MIRKPRRLAGQGEGLWKTRHGFVRKLELPPSCGGGACVLKYYDRPEFIRYLYRLSMVYREACAMQTASGLGLPVPPVYACGEKRFCCMLRSAYILTRYIGQTQQLLQLAKPPACDDPATEPLVVSLLTEIVTGLAKLHAAGYSHGGAHPRNFLWRQELASSKPTLFWIDLATFRPLQEDWRERIVLDLTDAIENFPLSPSHLDALCKAYQSVNPLPLEFQQLPNSETQRKKNVCKMLSC